MHLLNEDKRIEANSRIIQSMEYISKNGTQYGEIWSSIIEAAGFYPYLEKYKDKFYNNDTSSMITKEFFASENIEGIYFMKSKKLVKKNRIRKKCNSQCTDKFWEESTNRGSCC